MANIHSTLTELFTNIADTIREKKNTTETIIADTFPAEIENLKIGFDYVNQDVTIIPDEAFYGCEDIKSVDCYNLTKVGASAFENCKSLKTVILYDGVESVGEDAFKGCSDLTIYCEATSKPDSWHENWNPDDCKVVWEFALVETWDISATEDDNVTAKLYNDVQNEGYYVLIINGSGNMESFVKNSGTSYIRPPWYNLYCEKIMSVIINNGVTNIGAHAFREHYLTSIVLPKSIVYLNCYRAFSYCKFLKHINIPDSVISIGTAAFENCSSLTSITIPNSVTSIGNYAFCDCKSLTSITIPSSVTSIGDYIFDGCTALTSITIPESVVEIGTYEFYDCKSLEFINYTGTIAQWSTITFGSNWNYNTPNYTIYCTDGTISKDGTITYY